MRPACFFITFLLFIIFSCSPEEIISREPSDLSLEITQTEGQGDVLIVATANNTIEYQLWVGSNTEPLQTNNTGTFSYTFAQPGVYLIEVRAYSSSGRYIKATKELSINYGNDVSVDDGYNTPLSYPGYQLVWNDEFDGNNISSDNWVFEIGTGCPNLCGWGNNELQYYRQENARVNDGVLTIEARRENYSGSQYTSTRMKTQGKKSFMYGRIDVRALLPKGQGIWPAIWMLGDNITTIGWPKSGEIDIMEMIGGSGREKEVHGTLHWDNNGHAYTGGKYTRASGTFADEYHVFTIIWDEISIKWYVNDIKFHEINITPTHMTEFHEKFFFLLNIAVGGNWPGNPNESTVFPQQMKVDYIRVFQKNG
jgi:beta-glucanase (GH16 family)